MPSIITEHQQHIDVSGVPIVNGYIHIGSKGNDPKLIGNKITIYSDRGLSIPLANPQRTDTYGKSVNKIYVPGKYAIAVTDESLTQKYIDLDAGELPQTGITQLTNIQGTNTIIADGEPAIDQLVDKQAYIFQAVGGNTTAITLQIDLTAQKAVKKQHDQALVAGDIETNMIMYVVYNELDDWFEMVTPPLVLSATFFNVSNDLTVTGDIDAATGTIDAFDAATGTIDALTTDSITAKTTNGDLPLTGNGLGTVSIDGMHTKIIDIGDWNMDANQSVTIAHGLTFSKIRSVRVLIREDANLHAYDFPAYDVGASTNSFIDVKPTDIFLLRGLGGFFDATDFDSTSYNRGWITINYID